jgi:hypothetical protein
LTLGETLPRIVATAGVIENRLKIVIAHQPRLPDPVRYYIHTRAARVPAPVARSTPALRERAKPDDA